MPPAYDIEFPEAAAVITPAASPVREASRWRSQFEPGRDSVSQGAGGTSRSLQTPAHRGWVAGQKLAVTFAATHEPAAYRAQSAPTAHLHASSSRRIDRIDTAALAGPSQNSAVTQNGTAL